MSLVDLVCNRVFPVQSRLLLIGKIQNNLLMILRIMTIVNKNLILTIRVLCSEIHMALKTSKLFARERFRLDH
jgi:hypothetical protein